VRRCSTTTRAFFSSDLISTRTDSVADDRRHPPALRKVRGTWRDVLPVWAALSLITSIPYILAWVRTPEACVFSGVLTAYDDTFTYFAWIKQASGGRVLMCDLYTSEPQSCQFFLPLWVLLGLFSRITCLPAVLVFHIARVGGAFALLVAARFLISQIFRSRRRIRGTLWLFAFSAGIGWLLYLLESRGNLLDAAAATGSADLNIPEAFAFRSAFGQVHFTLGAALVIGSLALLFAGMTAGARARVALSGILVTILAVVHPYLVVVVVAIGAVTLFAAPLLVDRTSREAGYRARFESALLFSAGAAPGIAYLFYLNFSNDVLREWLKITDTRSPSPADYFLGFGIIGPLAIAGFVALWRSSGAVKKLVVLWAIVQALLLYAPVNFQRRLVEGLQLPLVIGASIAISVVLNRLRLRRNARRLAFASVLVVASLTNLGLLAGQLAGRGEATGANDPRRYLPHDVSIASDWMNRNCDPDATVLCSYLMGNVLPGRTGLRVFLGHYGQTMWSQQKGELVRSFYNGELSDAESREMIESNRISYVMFSPFERAVAPNWIAPNWLKLIHSEGEVAIYAVDR